MTYSVYDHDNLQPAEKLKIERSIYFNAESTDISHYTTLSVERLHIMRAESAAEEQKIYENLREATLAWEAQAGQTLLFDKAIEYVRIPSVKHTANQWEKTEYGQHVISNMVYKMTYSISEDTKYNRETKKSIPYAWYISWYVFTNNPDGYRGVRIAGQARKRYTDKAELNKYLNGRIKAYAHLFTAISPPVPQEYVKNFRVNGQLLPGYTIEGEEPKSLDRAAEVTVGSVSVRVTNSSSL